MVSEEPLVSISEASRILGVSEPALRQWTDEGKIKAFITPGGHRRYSRIELRRLMTSPHKSLGIKDLASRLEDTAGLHRDIARSFVSASSWYKDLDAESQKQLVFLGRRLLELSVRYVSGPSRRQETSELARGVGGDFGETLARLGLPLTDSVQAFLQHREPVVRMASDLIRKREMLTERIAEAIPMAERIIDEALVALVAAHQEHHGPGGVKGRGNSR